MYKLIYSRYYVEYSKMFNTLKEAKDWADSNEEIGEIYAVKIIEPDGKEIDLKKDFYLNK